jgi:hypothetical protein
LPKAKQKGTNLTVKEVKDMIYKKIQKKQKQVDPEKFNIRIVEDNLAEVEAMQQILAMIMDEERRRYCLRIILRQHQTGLYQMKN